MADRKNILLRLDPAVHDAVARWASDELRSTTAQIELLLRRALSDAGRLPREAGALPRRGRPPRERRGGVDPEEVGAADRPGQYPAADG